MPGASRTTRRRRAPAPPRCGWKVLARSSVLFIVRRPAGRGEAFGGRSSSGRDVVTVGPTEGRGFEPRGDHAELRALNERMWEVNVAFWEATGVFCVTCECGDPGCAETVQIAPEAYEHARRGARTFVVARDHAGREVERVVAEGAGYLVVELEAGPDGGAPARTRAADFASQHFR